VRAFVRAARGVAPKKIINCITTNLSRLGELTASRLLVSAQSTALEVEEIDAELSIELIREI
jgi:hypothetical protein